MNALRIPGRDRARKRMAGKSEQAVVREIVHWLKANQIFYWVVKNTGTYDPRAKRFRSVPWYFRAGVPDIHGFAHSDTRGIAGWRDVRPFVIEAKREEGGVVSPAQTEFKEQYELEVVRFGGVYVLARGLEDVQQAFAQAGLLTKI